MTDPDGPDEPCVLRTEPEPGVVLLQINRPRVRNALNLATRRALATEFEAVSRDSSVGAVVLTGDDRAFCAGADLGEYVDATPLDVIARDLDRLWGAITDCPVPVIAAVRGAAIGGGCELAMHADIVVAGRSARFAQPEVQIGITPGGGATQRLTRVAGKFVAMRMMLLGDPIDAEEARAIGLVSNLCDDADVLDHALSLARRLAGLPPLAVRQIKSLVLDSMNVPLEAGLRLEARAFQLTFATPEKTARIRAFLERRATRPPDAPQR